MSLSKLFQILVPLYANVPEAVLYNGICNKSRLRGFASMDPGALRDLSKISRREGGWEF